MKLILKSNYQTERRFGLITCITRRKLVSRWRFLDCFFEKSVIVRAVKIEVFFN